MNTLRSLALTHTTTLNDAYNEATQIARAATMEGNGAVLTDYYTFEEYIARRGAFIIKLPEYKHLTNACWVVRKNDANLIFADEQQQLTVREVRRRELANEVEPLLPLPTTSNTESLDNFRHCRPEDWPEWRADELDGDGGQEGEWDVQTPGGGSEAFYTPATSPVEGGLAFDAGCLASNAVPDAAASITDHAEPLQQSGLSPAPSFRSHGLDVNHHAFANHAPILSSTTVANNEQSFATQQHTNIQGIDSLSLFNDYSLETLPIASGNQIGLHNSHDEYGRQPNAPQAATSRTPQDPLVISMLATQVSYDPELKALMGEVSAGTATPEQVGVFQQHCDNLGAFIQSQRSQEAAEEQRRLANHHTAVMQGMTTVPSSQTPTHVQAQAAPEASLPEGSTTPLKDLRPNWQELATKQPQATTTTSPIEAPRPKPAKEKIFTPHPDVSSLARYGIFAPVKNREDTKRMGGSALRQATPVKNVEVSKDKAESALKPATPIVTMAAPPVPIMTSSILAAPVAIEAPPDVPVMAAPTIPIVAAPQPTTPVVIEAPQTTPIVATPKSASLPETPKEAVEPAQKPDSPLKSVEQSVEPAPEHQKGTRGVAQPAPLSETPKEAVASVQESGTPQESVEPAPKGTCDVAQPAPLPETPTEAVATIQKPDSPHESAEPPAKRLKGTRGVAQPVKTPASKNKNPLATNTPIPTPGVNDSSSSAPTKLAKRLASIISGASLPKTKAEARAAAAEHHARLLAAHNSQTPAPTEPNRRTSTRLISKPTNPDLMPFYFSRPPPDPKQGEQEQDFIRCVCGVQHDDGDNMICCEACEVWQHSACVVPGLTEGQLEKLKWECTVCDPWANRDVLRKLRLAANAKEGKEVKEVKGGKRRASAAPAA
jgi:hypothetical protein